VQDDEAEVEKEEKLVAARNEENAKVSAAALKEDTSSSTPVIETIPVTKPTTLTLRHTYKEGESENVFYETGGLHKIGSECKRNVGLQVVLQTSRGCLISEALQQCHSVQIVSNKAWCGPGSSTLVVLWKPLVLVAV